MKNLYLFLMIFFISCKNNVPFVDNIFLDTSSKSDSNSSVVKVISTDTIFFTYQDDKKYNDYALAHLLKKTYSKDSICNLKFKIDFLQKREIVYTDKIEIKSATENSQWNGSYEMDSIFSPFKRLSFGYPACGYDQSNFLFYIDGKNSSKAHTWSSVGDSGWYSDVNFTLISNTKISANTKSFWPDETSANEDVSGEEYGVLEYLDSIHFTKNRNKWLQTNITPKQKVYRKKRISFTEYYKLNE